MRFEYHTTNIYIDDHPYKTATVRISETVESYVDMGYELVSVVPGIKLNGESHRFSGEYILVFKRPLTG